jgi:uncharacterized protein YjbJ (UPF0337 family)
VKRLGKKGVSAMQEREYDWEYDWNDRLQDEGTWDTVRGHIREEWGDLTDQETEQARGNWDKFVGTVKEKTGETADAIERKFKEWTS